MDFIACGFYSATLNIAYRESSVQPRLEMHEHHLILLHEYYTLCIDSNKKHWLNPLSCCNSLQHSTKSSSSGFPVSGSRISGSILGCSKQRKMTNSHSVDGSPSISGGSLVDLSPYDLKSFKEISVARSM